MADKDDNLDGTGTASTTIRD